MYILLKEYREREREREREGVEKFFFSISSIILKTFFSFFLTIINT